ncbi:MAG TPA: ribonuclease H-like domain-containing protein [Syntrophales bacterium]|nr:ribonuclease H-like domain-containing protein [Syntrophales bacterium]HPX80634.1 ribonuclease H-like domain-containing protein [Syntrophales bacterium]HQK79475.1 ribonuclease H-like domain-containing protein [Syntrophales bacterium]
MTVIDRLQRLTKEAVSPPRKAVLTPGEGTPVRETHRSGESEASCSQSEASSLKIGALRRRLDAVLARRPGGADMSPPRRREPGHPLEEIVSGMEIATAGGRFFCAASAWGMGHCHGACRLGDLPPLDMAGAAILANDAALAGLDPGRGVFLDTETTGLAGGTGTVAFLIGLGWFEGARFVVKQLFMRDFAEERAALLFLGELMADRQFLVTFNGKAFDANLLAARFVMNRLADPLAGLPHLDLLHPARRLLRCRLDNVRLGTLEGALLGLEREEDIPGWEIPQRYFQWLRHRDGGLVADIFVHNRLDVLSMAFLAARLTELIGGPVSGAAPPPPDPDLLAAARLCIHRGETARAEGILTDLRRRSGPTTARQAATLLSLIHKRAGAWNEAVAIWREMLAPDRGGPDGDALFPLLELAKWNEHRDHDYRTALELACRALDLLPPQGTATEENDLRRRIARLKRRLAGQDRPAT